MMYSTEPVIFSGKNDAAVGDLFGLTVLAASANLEQICRNDVVWPSERKRN